MKQKLFVLFTLLVNSVDLELLATVRVQPALTNEQSLRSSSVPERLPFGYPEDQNQDSDYCQNCRNNISYCTFAKVGACISLLSLVTVVATLGVHAYEKSKEM